MSRTKLEVADIFRGHGPAWRQANAGHVSIEQLKVMSAIENCRTAALGGHVARCENEKCGHTQIACNSCRNRHCPKCQGAAAREWLAEREAELLPVPYFHVVFSLPAQVADIAYQNKAAIYDILFKASAETMLAIAADPKHLGVRIAILSVLHTWGSALTHHPHVHMIVPGGGISLDGTRWVACRPNFLLAVEVLSRLFRRLVLEKLANAHQAGQLQFFGKHASLTNARAFAAYLAPLRRSEWVVYSKRPFGGPKEVLRYLARYTHRVAISNRRLVSLDDNGVTFKWKDYRIEGPQRYKVMTLDTHEFIRRFLMHVLPQGFHRIRSYGLLTSQTRAKNIARARELLAVPLIPVDAIKAANANPEEPKAPEHPCPCCGSCMRIIEIFLRGQQPNASRSPQHRPTPLPPKIRFDTS
jgi:Putative transposase/Transposase zinc-binding domain